MSDSCTYCRNPRSLHGCGPGRCFGPQARADAPAATTPPAPLRPPRATKPLGVQRAVVAHEYRLGPHGGEKLVVWLECRCIVSMGAGTRRRPPPRAMPCIRCAPVEIHCAGGCGLDAPIDAVVRGRTWVFLGSTWWCRACALRVLST